jgi:hypothetical protein
MKAVFQIKAVQVQPEAQGLADDQQYSNVEENGQGVDLPGAHVGDVAEIARPARSQQHNQHGETQGEIGYAQAPPDAVVAPRRGRIGWRRAGGRISHKQAISAWQSAFGPSTVLISSLLS